MAYLPILYCAVLFVGVVFGQLAVHKYLHPVSAYYGTCAEALPRSVVGVVPVAYGHAGRRFVHVLVKRVEELLESLLVVSHCSRPHYPVALGVFLAAVERQAVLLLLG